MKLLVIIPAYNEQKNIAHVVDSLRMQCPEHDFLIVNDGSRDATAQICKENGYPFLDLPVNLGLSGAVQAGLKYAYQHGYSHAIQLDADGQHRAEYISDMIKAMNEQSADIVIASRFLTVKKPKTLRMFGSYLISWAMRFTTGMRICDPTSGMRLYNKRMIFEFATDANYTPEPDTISYLLLGGARICEVQVTMDERVAGKSYLTFTRSVTYMIRMGLSIIVVQWFRKRPKKEGTT